MNINGSVANLNSFNINNAMSSYKIDSNEKWEFYDNPNFENILFTDSGPTDWTKVDVVHNDKVSSVKLVNPRK
jgi:hypothetical protein